jgi:hypothetical protein
VPLKRKYKALLVVAILLAAGCSAVWYSMAASQSRSISLIGFDQDRAFGDCEYLCNLGPRVPGSAQDEQSALYVQSKFQDAGLSKVHLEEFQETTFQVDSANLSLITIQARGNIVTTYTHLKDFVLYQYSASTAGDLRFEIADVGNGSEEAFNGVDVTGKAVLTTAQCLPRAAEKGARAVIVQNVRLGEQTGWPPYAGGLYGTDANGDNIPYPDAYPNDVVPTCAVSRAVGDEIRDAINGSRKLPLVGSNVRVQFNFQTTISKKTIADVVGDVAGTRRPGDIIYIVAHRDCTYINPGAVDNAAGVATIMEMARKMAHRFPDRTIRFIATDSEEQGMLGVTEYCRAHEQEVQKHGLVCINFDMNDVNLERVKSLVIFCSNANYSRKLEDITKLFRDRYPDIARKYAVNITKGGGGADGAVFMKRGTDGLLAEGEWGSSWEYHTQGDTLAHVNRESWLVGGVLLGTLALEIART